MGFQSQAGFVGFKTQAAKGAYLDPGAVAPNQGVFVRTRSGAMGTNRDLLIPDPEVGGNRDVSDAQLGPVAFAGEYDFYVRMEALAFFLKAALGGGASVVDAGAVATGYTHTITPTDGTLPWISIEEQIGNGLLNLKYTDNKCNTFHMEADSNGFLMGTAGFVGLTQAIDGAPTPDISKRWDTSGLMTGPTVTVTWNAVQLPAKSFSLDVNNNLESDDFRLGSLFLGDAVEKRRELTMGVTIRDQDASLWKTATWGAPAATVAGGTTTRQQVVITVTSYEMIPGSTGPAVPYSLVITLPKAVIKPFNESPSGDDVIQNDLEIQAIRPDPATPILTAVVKNSYATVP
jgi:hypothetical protein